MRSRLSVGALGVALVALLGVAWATGLAYLAARLGLGAHVRLVLVDVVHVYCGLLGGVVVVAKIVRVRGGRPAADRWWERRVSRALLILYAVVLGTGMLALLPAPFHTGVLQLHLMSAAWVLLPVGWHVWLHHARALPYVVPGRRGRRLWAGVALVALPGLALAAVPRPLSVLSDADGGGVWTRVLSSAPLARVAVAPDARTLVAGGGNTVLVTRDSRSWRRLSVAAPPADAAPGFTAAAAHGHADVALSVRAVLATDRAVFVGTSQGLYRAALPDARSLTRLDFPGRALDGLPVGFGYPGTDVRALVARPAAHGELWAASPAGPLHSTDGGATWRRVASGLARPSEVSALAFVGERLFAGDPDGIHELVGARWELEPGPPSVVELSGGSTLYAVTGGGTLAELAGGHWRMLRPVPGPGAHQSHAVHAQPSHPTLTSAAVGVYAAGTADGIAATTDRGRSWTALGGGLARHAPTQVAAYRGALWAATADGLFRYPLPVRVPPATGRWWLGMLAAVLLGTGFSVFAAARERR